MQLLHWRLRTSCSPQRLKRGDICPADPTMPSISAQSKDIHGDMVLDGIFRPHQKLERGETYLAGQSLPSISAPKKKDIPAVYLCSPPAEKPCSASHLLVWTFARPLC
ncbi:hypothetical protein FQN60_014465 [Etheostoma spectabile]|uniref:Uncharacterized protein n=1 Tax=Etheostoma spectabile TaxID=54343 RepID=A0A5J5DDM3_9PERO|nr:hypothetical protein FQN60_014465 [Etheostoma spectabile]